MAFIENIKLVAILESGPDGTEREIQLPLDPTMISTYRHNQAVYISLRQNSDMPTLDRAEIKAVTILKASAVTLNNGSALTDALPPSSRIIITSGSLRYRTAHYSGYLFRSSRINDDLVGYSGYEDEDETVRIATPLSRSEMRNPREEDKELANSLQDHLNDNLEYYHRAIWMNMSPERRFMFLDGIQVVDYSERATYPEGVVRSVASVVENRVIGVAGNSLVVPVAPGFRLDPNIRGQEVDLFALYKPPTPLEPTNISIPTKGIFAEAVTGQCNSCEKIDDTRFWRWSEEPLPDDPTAIQPIGTGSRDGDTGDLTAKDFAQPMILQQNAPALPDPQGLSSLSQLLGTSSFKDITGLDANQRNALQALTSSLQAAQAFGTEAAKLAALGQVLNSKMPQVEKDKLAKEISKSISKGSASKLIDNLDTFARVTDMENRGEISKPDADRIKQSVTDNIVRGSQTVADSPGVRKLLEKSRRKSKINSADQ